MSQSLEADYEAASILCELRCSQWPFRHTLWLTLLLTVCLCTEQFLDILCGEKLLLTRDTSKSHDGSLFVFFNFSDLQLLGTLEVFWNFIGRGGGVILLEDWDRKGLLKCLQMSSKKFIGKIWTL